MRNPAHALPLTIWATPLPQRRGPARPCLAPSDGGKGQLRDGSGGVESRSVPTARRTPFFIESTRERPLEVPSQPVDDSLKLLLMCDLTRLHHTQ